MPKLILVKREPERAGGRTITRKKNYIYHSKWERVLMGGRKHEKENSNKQKGKNATNRNTTEGRQRKEYHQTIEKDFSSVMTSTKKGRI